jgi:predicted RNA-binding protein (virulence factor B family)
MLVGSRTKGNVISANKGQTNMTASKSKKDRCREDNDSILEKIRKAIV